MDKDLRVGRRQESIFIRGETFDLLPERCAFRRSDQTLLASDLHWGKAETFQSFGLALPSTIVDDDLARLSAVLNQTGAKRLLILGDLIHTPRGVNQHVEEKIATWRSQHSAITIEVIRGNHDRKFTWPESWKMLDVGTEVRENKFLFTHDQPVGDAGDLFIWMGHVHPVVHLQGGGDSLKLPCFMIEENLGLLPAFSAFTGGASIGARAAGKRVFAIADESVIEV